MQDEVAFTAVGASVVLIRKFGAPPVLGALGMQKVASSVVVQLRSRFVDPVAIPLDLHLDGISFPLSPMACRQGRKMS